MFQRIANGRTDLVFDHLQEGHAPDACDAHGTSLIRWCAYYGDVTALRLLVSRGARLDALGENLDLTGAAFHGHWQLCQYLLEHGADARHPASDTGETPLHAALCKAGRPAYNLVVRLLLAAGANPNAATRPGVPTGSFMRDCRTRGETPLHRAAAYADADCVSALLEAGADRQARDGHGETPLTWASWHLRPGAILKLLCYGPHELSDAGAAHHCVDHGQGWGGLEASLRGTP